MEAGGGDVWVLDVADAVQRRFTFDRSQENASPVWSPDGTRIVFRSRRGAGWALVEESADGAGAETTLAEFPHVVSPMSWSPDGTHAGGHDEPPGPATAGPMSRSSQSVRPGAPR
jgi:Tol biopolymer transport system component